MFDEIPEWLYTIECEGYFDKNGNPLEDEESIKHLISGEPPVNIDDDVLERSDENGNFLCYEDYYEYLSRDHNRHDLNKITKKIRPKKFICEAPIDSGKSTAIRKLISSYKTEKFMVIVPTVNIAEEFYTKLNDKSIRLCVNNNAFKEFHKAIHNEMNTIITTLLLNV